MESIEATHGSQLLDRIMKKQQEVSKSRSDICWAAIHFFIALWLYSEISFGQLLLSFGQMWLSMSTSIYIVNTIMLPAARISKYVFFICFVFYFLRYTKYCFFSSVVELTMAQQKLYGILDSEPGFRIISSAVQQKMAPFVTAVPNYSPTSQSFRCSTTHSSSLFDQSLNRSSSFCGGLFSSLPHSTPSPYSLPRSGRPSPTPYSQMDASCGSLSSSYNASLPLNQSSSSGMLHHSANVTSNFGQEAFTDAAFQKTKTRLKKSPKISPLRTDNCIQDISTLNQFLREEQDRQTAPVTADMAVGSSTIQQSFWSYGRTAAETLPALRHFQYQLAPRPVQLTTCTDDPAYQADSPSTEHVWSKLGVTMDQVDRWVENLRKWLGKTILAQIVTEIDEINKLLVRYGSDDVQIGESSLSTLKQLSVVKSQQLPQLAALLPYIDMVPNQEYLIHRIRELASGGCISAFKWNGGAEFKGKRWDDTLPTDASILIHLLCSYLDARLPDHPKYPDGKTFTNQHFIITPDKPNLVDNKDHLYIYQTRINPPHFKVVIEDTVWNVKEGRHNLFHAILLFLYHIKTKEHGMLRRINLGMSGINILWVFDY